MDIGDKGDCVINQETMKVPSTFAEQLKKPYKEKLYQIKRTNCRLVSDVVKLRDKLYAAMQIIEEFSNGFQSQEQSNELLAKAEKFLKECEAWKR